MQFKRGQSSNLAIKILKFLKRVNDYFPRTQDLTPTIDAITENFQLSAFNQIVNGMSSEIILA